MGVSSPELEHEVTSADKEQATKTENAGKKVYIRVISIQSSDEVVGNLRTPKGNLNLNRFGYIIR